MNTNHPAQPTVVFRLLSAWHRRQHPSIETEILSPRKKNRMAPSAIRLEGRSVLGHHPTLRALLQARTCHGCPLTSTCLRLAA